jgi:GGDEF domain-containing protein
VRPARHDFPVSAVMADLDFFNKINDTYGTMLTPCSAPWLRESSPCCKRFAARHLGEAAEL